jgi:hypothetical protein
MGGDGKEFLVLKKQYSDIPLIKIWQYSIQHTNCIYL